MVAEWVDAVNETPRLGFLPGPCDGAFLMGLQAAFCRHSVTSNLYTPEPDVLPVARLLFK